MCFFKKYVLVRELFHFAFLHTIHPSVDQGTDGCDTAVQTVECTCNLARCHGRTATTPQASISPPSVTSLSPLLLALIPNPKRIPNLVRAAARRGLPRAPPAASHPGEKKRGKAFDSTAKVWIFDAKKEASFPALISLVLQLQEILSPLENLDLFLKV